jgi:hypothetical protein
MGADIAQNRRTARLAGLQYFALAVAGGFGMLYVPSLLIVPGDTSATVNNILASERLFRLGLVAGILSQVLLLTLALTLHKLLRDIHPQRAALMVAFVAVGVSIACLNTLNPLAALLFLNGADYLDALGSQWRHTQAMVCLDLYGQGVVIAEIFWGLWLLPFGALVMKSRFIPRILGVALVLACFGYLVDCAFQLLVPEVAAIVTPIATTPAAIAEFSMIFWLLIKGVRDVQPATGPVAA